VLTVNYNTITTIITITTTITSILNHGSLQDNTHINDYKSLVNKYYTYNTRYHIIVMHIIGVYG